MQRGVQQNMDEKTLEAERTDCLNNLKHNEYRDQGPWKVLENVRKLSDIQVPFYLAGNWIDSEVHCSGNILAFNRISSKEKWLEMHSGNHIAAFYSPDHVARQKQFLDYFLLEKAVNGMKDVP